MRTMQNMQNMQSVKNMQNVINMQNVKKYAKCVKFSFSKKFPPFPSSNILTPRSNLCLTLSGSHRLVVALAVLFVDDAIDLSLVIILVC